MYPGRCKPLTWGIDSRWGEWFIFYDQVIVYTFIGTVQKRHIRSKFCGVLVMPWAVYESSKAETKVAIFMQETECYRHKIATISFFRVSNIDISSFSPLKHHLWAFFKVILPWLVTDELARLLLLLRERNGYKIKFSHEEGLVFQVLLYFLRGGSDVPAKMYVKAKAVSH